MKRPGNATLRNSASVAAARASAVGVISILALNASAAPLPSSSPLRVPAQVLILLKPPAYSYAPLDAGRAEALRSLGAVRVEDRGPYVYLAMSATVPTPSVEAAAGLRAFDLPNAFDVEIGGIVRDVRKPFPAAAAPSELFLEDYPDPGMGLYIVKLAMPAEKGWFDRLRGAELRPIQYVSWNAWIVAAPAGLGRVATMLADEAIHIEPLQPWDKLALDLRADQASSKRPMSLLFDGKQDTKALRQALVAIDPRATVSIDARGEGNADFDATSAEARALARRPESVWLQRRPLGEPSDERAAQVAVGHHENNLPTRPHEYKDWLGDSNRCGGCLGVAGLQEETVSVFDTGLSEYSGVPGSRAHEDLERDGNPALRRAWTTFGCCGLENANTNDITYHGTVVTGLIAGDPQPPGGLGVTDQSGFLLGTGIAPGVRFGMTRMAYTGSLGPNVSASTLAGATMSVFDSGARYQNNSWNFKPNSPQTDPLTHSSYTYDDVARKYDILVRDARVGVTDVLAASQNPISVVFSVGNIRNQDPNRDDAHTEVRAPATAKNVISVGASGLATWDISAVPCRTQISIRDIPSLSRRRVASAPERIKPDLVAPGRSTVSTRSYSGASADCAYDNGNIIYEGGGSYLAEHGTSFAAPQVTGAAVLVKRFAGAEKGGSPPSPALIKAVLIGSAESMQGGVDFVTGYTLGWEPGPQGFGRLSLKRLLDDPTARRYRDDVAERFTSAGGTRTSPTRSPTLRNQSS
mgnify:CR=1 FL=1